MIRLVFIAIAILAAIWLAIRIWKEVQSAQVDWRGVALASGFVGLAIYLSHVTGIGGIG